MMSQQSGFPLATYYKNSQVALECYSKMLLLKTSNTFYISAFLNTMKLVAPKEFSYIESNVNKLLAMAKKQENIDKRTPSANGLFFSHSSVAINDTIITDDAKKHFLANKCENRPNAL